MTKVNDAQSVWRTHPQLEAKNGEETEAGDRDEEDVDGGDDAGDEVASGEDKKWRRRRKSDHHSQDDVLIQLLQTTSDVNETGYTQIFCVVCLLTS